MLELDSTLNVGSYFQWPVHIKDGALAVILICLNPHNADLSFINLCALLSFWSISVGGLLGNFPTVFCYWHYTP